MKKYSAFTLIELSLVILISGLIVAGVMQGIKVLNTSKLNTAQVLTKKSPVLDISDLMLWYETSLLESFPQGDASNGKSIATWYDISPKVATNKLNATQATTANKPTFVANAINGGIPAIRFDGSNDYLSYNGSFLSNASYTLFIVEKRLSGAIWSPLLSGTNNGVNLNLIIWYEGLVIRHSHFGSDLDVAVSAFTTPITKIHTFWFSKSSVSGGKKYWLNGGTNPDGSNSSQTTGLTSYIGGTIGASIPFNFYLNGDIAEIIMFNRALSNAERQSIETYLSRKYNIAIS